MAKRIKCPDCGQRLINHSRGRCVLCFRKSNYTEKKASNAETANLEVED